MLIFSCTTPGNTLLGQALYQLQYPFSTSPFAGAEFHILVHNELSRLENNFIPSEIFHRENAWLKAGNILYRLTRMGSYGFYMAYLPVVNQHEYFGHLARAKQLYAGSTRYEIYFFPPRGGRAYFGNSKYNTLTDMELCSEYMGGVEANAIMAAAIRRNALLEGRMSFQDAMLYLGSGTDFVTYVFFEDNDSYDDVSQYLSVLNLHEPKENHIQRDDLVLPSVFSVLLDPFTLQTAANLVWQFLINGHASYNAPSMLRVGRVGILPYYSFEPGAFGFRHCLNGYLRTDRHMYHFSCHKGALHVNNDFGLQAELYGNSIIRKLLSFDLDLRYWHNQEEAYHNIDGEVQLSKLSGALVGGKLYLQIPPWHNQKRRFSVLTGFSLKTPGYTKAYPLVGGLSYCFGIAYSS